MSRCLCCGKEIPDTASEEEKRTCWHDRCSARFFGTRHIPTIDLSEQTLQKIVLEKVSDGSAVTGVQKKLSLHYERAAQRLTLTGDPAGYILKPQTDLYPWMPEYEDAAMRIAEAAGIQTVPHGMILISGQRAYITKRIDRKEGKNGTSKYAMEDFCQLSLRLTEDKYHGSYEGCGRVIEQYSSRQGIDATEMFLRVVISFLTGNSDMHLKNFSLIEKHPGKRDFVLSPAYDMIPASVILPEDEEDMALTLNGKKRHLHRNDFRKLANSIAVDATAAVRIIDRAIKEESLFEDVVHNSFLPESEQQKLIACMRERTERLIK